MKKLTSKQQDVLFETGLKLADVGLSFKDAAEWEGEIIVSKNIFSAAPLPELPLGWCWVKAKIVEDGTHINDGKAMVVSIPRIDDPKREVTIYVWKFNVQKQC